MTKYRSIAVEVVSAVGWLRFDRAPVNAFDRAMLDETISAAEALLDDEAVRVLVLGSTNPRYFSAGADLATFADYGPEEMADWVNVCHALVRRLRASPKPILAAIRGVAVGGGLEMSLHADLRFAARDARFGQPEVKIAFLPPVAGTQALARLVGRSEALRMLYTGDLIDADKALAIGLVDDLSEADVLEANVQVFAEALASRPANALAALRRCVVEGGALPFAKGMAIEAEEAADLASHPNFAEGLKAFLEKREPDWR